MDTDGHGFLDAGADQRTCRWNFGIEQKETKGTKSRPETNGALFASAPSVQRIVSEWKFESEEEA